MTDKKIEENKVHKLLFEDVGERAFLPRLLHTLGEKDETLSHLASRVIFVRAVCGEFLCTVIFLFVAMAVPFNMKRMNVESSELEAMAVAWMGVALIYSFADISGANFNPAVTFATVVTGKVTWRKGVAYMIAQMLGSCFATFWFIVTFPDATGSLASLALQPSKTIAVNYHIMMEFTLTFILVYVIFSVAFDTVNQDKVEIKQVSGDAEVGSKDVQVEKMVIYTTGGDSKSAFAPISIGFQLGLLSMVGGSVSGGAYNPARAFGAAMISGVWSDQWIIWLGDLCGAAAAGFCQLGFQKLRAKAGAAEKKFQEQQNELAVASGDKKIEMQPTKVEPLATPSATAPSTST